MNTKAIVFDLDDTLIDTKERHFNVVKDFISAYGKTLNFEEYLNMRKFNNWSNSEIIKQIYNLNENDFSSFWKINIERREYLNYDVEIVNNDLLMKLKSKGDYDFILLSLRSDFDTAEEQFKNFSFCFLFDKYFFLKHNDINPKIEKLKYYKNLYKHIIFISDSQADYNAATNAGIEFIGVQSGIYHLFCNENFDNINSFLLNNIQHA
jgi:phosphoglycolate phosphatase-like HAD superfamily hydrolase